MTYSAADGLVRVYPADAAAPRPTPGLVWAHGGGFVAGDLDMPEADWVARSLAARAVTVVSIDYRLAVDGAGRYPAGSDDVLAAWSWTLEHAEELDIDPSRLPIGGASAGANLVTGAVLRLLHPRWSSSDAGGDAYRDRAPGLVTAAELPTRPPELPAGVLLAYPTLLAVQPAPDAALRALLDANPLADRFGPAAVRAMYEDYLGGPVDEAPLPAVPGRAEASDLVGFPPVLMINDEADELRVSGELFAATLASAGVAVDLVTEPGTDHGHLNRPDEPAASASIERMVRWIDGLDTAAARPTRPADHHRTTLRITEGITP